MSEFIKRVKSLNQTVIFQLIKEKMNNFESNNETKLLNVYIYFIFRNCCFMFKNQSKIKTLKNIKNYLEKIAKFLKTYVIKILIIKFLIFLLIYINY